MAIIIRLGRPTHLQAGRSTACGRPNVVFITTDRNQVDCVACRRTKEFRRSEKQMNHDVRTCKHKKGCPLRDMQRLENGLWVDRRVRNTARDKDCTCAHRPATE